MTASAAHGQMIEVVIAGSIGGSIGGALRSAFPNLSATCSPPSTVFRVELARGQQSKDLAALLKERGLVLLNARRVPPDKADDDRDRGGPRSTEGS